MSYKFHILPLVLLLTILTTCNNLTLSTKSEASPVAEWDHTTQILMPRLGKNSLMEPFENLIKGYGAAHYMTQVIHRIH